MKVKDNILRISGIVSESIVDGKGIRYVIFTQGCPHNCKGCHNPQTHDFSQGENKEISEIISEVKQNPLLMGVTLSGGEPFCQAETLIPLSEELKALGLNIWAYSGYTYEQLIDNVQPFTNKLLSLVDVLVDGPFILTERDLTLQFCGSKNQRVIDCNKSREQKQVVLLGLN